jgi:hypothetical protein
MSVQYDEEMRWFIATVIKALTNQKTRLRREQSREAMFPREAWNEKGRISFKLHQARTRIWMLE